MKKPIALLTGISFCLVTSPLALRAQDGAASPSPTPGGNCSQDGGGCQGGKHHKHHHNSDGNKPAASPSPSPAR